MIKKALILAFLGLFLTAGLAAAQVASKGKIIGQVTDHQNSFLPGATDDAASAKSVGRAITSFGLKGNALNGLLPMGGPHGVKAYGFRAFPIGLTVGVVTYSRSGPPITTELPVNNVQGYPPENRADLGGLPLAAWADLYVEYTLRIAKTSASINLLFNNVTNSKTWLWYSNRPNGVDIHMPDEEILSKTFDGRAKLNAAGDLHWKNASFNRPTWQFGTWGARIGARFSF